MRFACADCLKGMSSSEALKFVSAGSEGGYCNNGGHFYCQKEGCFRKLSMSKRGFDEAKNEAWFVCGTCGSKNLYAIKGKSEPNFIYKVVPGKKK